MSGDGFTFGYDEDKLAMLSCCDSGVFEGFGDDGNGGAPKLQMLDCCWRRAFLIGGGGVAGGLRKLILDVTPALGIGVDGKGGGALEKLDCEVCGRDSIEYCSIAS